MSDHSPIAPLEQTLLWLTIHPSSSIRCMIPCVFRFEFDKEGKEAGALYTSLFKNSRIKNTSTLHDTPSGSVDIVNIELAGQELTLLSAGPLFKFTPAISIRQKITPTLMFVGKQGKADEAIRFYTSVFHNSRIGHVLRYGRGEEPDKEGTVKHAAFTLEGEDLAAMEKMLASKDKEKIARVTKAFLQMKKFDLAKLEEAFQGARAR